VARVCPRWFTINFVVPEVNLDGMVLKKGKIGLSPPRCVPLSVNLGKPNGLDPRTLPGHHLLKNPLHTDATMIPNLVKMPGDVDGNHFKRQGVDPRDKASLLCLEVHAQSKCHRCLEN
jgi:hypothetical protein